MSFPFVDQTVEFTGAGSSQTWEPVRRSVLAVFAVLTIGPAAAVAGARLILPMRGVR